VTAVVVVGVDEEEKEEEEEIINWTKPPWMLPLLWTTDTEEQ
jgi:hypothetical protein